MKHLQLKPIEIKQYTISAPSMSSTDRNFSFYARTTTDSLHPRPILIVNDLSEFNISRYISLLYTRAGIYAIVSTIDNKRYVGSAKSLYLRLLEHLRNKKSNKLLQSSIYKNGLSKFHFYVYEYFKYENKAESHKYLTDLECSFLKKFPLVTLYNYTSDFVSIKGYKDTEPSISKMKDRYEDITKHPMYGKRHSADSRKLISRPGNLNPMYDKTHSEESKKLMSTKKNKYPLGVGI